MRIGAVHSLKFRDLSPKQTEHGRVYRIEVYSSSSDSYFCYCNVETTKILDKYLKERTDAMPRDSTGMGWSGRVKAIQDEFEFYRNACDN